MLSNSRVTKLGDLLRGGYDDASTLTELEEYRSEFIPSYNYVVRVLQEKLYLSVTGRFKSTLSIIEKLRRSSSRLAQIQDIAGCRVVVASTMEQRRVTDSLRQWFLDIRIVDRTIDSSHGYRAIHVLVKHGGRTVEVQIRTMIQNFWASISEKMADIHGQEVKYGGGPPDLQEHLLFLAESFEVAERANEDYAKATVRFNSARKAAVPNSVWKALREEKADAKKRFDTSMRQVSRLLSSDKLRGI